MPIQLAFPERTARHADIVLPGSLHEEDEVAATSAEGRVIKINKAVDPPGAARADWHILCGLAARSGNEKHFAYEKPEDIFNELRVAPKGGTGDYFGIAYEKIGKQQGVFCPCPERDHPGTLRLFEDGKFYTPDHKAHFHAVEYRPPAEVTDDEYVESRRGKVTLPARVVTTIREDTVFIPYHGANEKSANLLTIRSLDPFSRIPEYKVCAVRVSKATENPL